jgi:hypothetical protein
MSSVGRQCQALVETLLLIAPHITIFDMSSIEDIQRRIIELEVEHRDLDAVIDTLAREGHRDELQLRRLKKRKLQLKDHIMLLKMQLIPDIPA